MTEHPAASVKPLLKIQPPLSGKRQFVCTTKYNMPGLSFPFTERRLLTPATLVLMGKSNETPKEGNQTTPLPCNPHHTVPAEDEHITTPSCQAHLLSILSHYNDKSLCESLDIHSPGLALVSAFPLEKSAYVSFTFSHLIGVDLSRFIGAPVKGHNKSRRITRSSGFGFKSVSSRSECFFTVCFPCAYVFPLSQLSIPVSF